MTRIDVIADPMDWTAGGSANLFDPGQGPAFPNEVAAHGYYFDPTSPAMSNPYDE